MKKRLLWIIPLLLVAIFVSGICLEFTLCKLNTSHELTEEIDQVLHTNWPHKVYPKLNWKADNRFYGSYGDCFVVFTTCPSSTEDYNSIRVAGTMFVWRRPFTILVFRNGECEDIIDAYDQGWLTWVQVRSIVSYHQEVWGGMAKLPARSGTADLF